MWWLEQGNDGKWARKNKMPPARRRKAFSGRVEFAGPTDFVGNGVLSFYSVCDAILLTTGLP